MNRRIWEFLVKGKDPVIRHWLKDKDISVRDQAKLDYALQRLRSLDRGLISPKLLAEVGDKILKLRVRCENRELRPMLCRGPVGDPLDYTLLAGALEIGDDLHPANVKEKAKEHRAELVEKATWRQIY